MASTAEQKRKVRDIVISHAHLDHIAGLPLFIDDLFATLTQPVRIHASAEVIQVLEHDIFNWRVYPRFSELSNGQGPVLEYCEIEGGRGFKVSDLFVLPIGVNIRVPSSGFICSDSVGDDRLTGGHAATVPVMGNC